MERGQSCLSLFKIAQVQNTPTREGESTIQENGIRAEWRIDPNILNDGIFWAIPIFQRCFCVVLQKVNRREEVVRPRIRRIDAQRGCQMLLRLNQVLLSKRLAGQAEF